MYDVGALSIPTHPRTGAAAAHGECDKRGSLESDPMR